MFFIVLPIVGLGSVVSQVPVLLSLVEHVLFGVATAAAYVPYQRQVPRMGGRYRDMTMRRHAGAT
jgi:hypothetical protein